MQNESQHSHQYFALKAALTSAKQKLEEKEEVLRKKEEELAKRTGMKIKIYHKVGKEDRYENPNLSKSRTGLKRGLV